MNKNELQEFIKTTLCSHLNEPGGRILYSSHETLKPGPIYLLGYNPGGKVNENNASLEKNIDFMLENTNNAYIDEVWENENKEFLMGCAPLQKRINNLFSNINIELRSVCASNLIFFQSRDTNSIDSKLADKCWPVHENIIEIIKPKVIICFGNGNPSSFAYLRYRLSDSISDENSMPSGHGSWLLKNFKCKINGRTTFVAGLPHLSRFDSNNKPFIIKWLDNQINQ